MKRTLFLLAAVFCFSVSGLVLAGEIKIYSSEGVQTITVPDEEKDIGGNWIRLPQDSRILIMEEGGKAAVQKSEAEKEAVLEKKPQESLIKAKRQFEQTEAGRLRKKTTGILN